VVAVLARVQEGVDGVEGGFGDFGGDGGLAAGLVPQDFEVEDGEQAGFEGGRQAGQDVPSQGEPVQQGQVHGLGGGLGQGFELGFGLLAFVVKLGEPGTDAGAQRGGCGVVGVGGDLL